MSQFLAQSIICTDPLKRVKVVCEAALMVNEKERSNLAIDYGQIEILNAIANAFLNVAVRRYDGGVDLFVIPWGFLPVEENYQKYVKPWFNCAPVFWSLFLSKHAEFGRDSYNRPYVKKIITDPLWSFFFDASNCLSADGYNNLKNSFSAWAIPIVQQYLAELTRVVSPSVYGEVLGFYSKSRKKDYGEKVKEKSESLTHEIVLDSRQ